MEGNLKACAKKAGLWAYYYFFSLAASAHPTGLLHKSLAYKQVVGRELLYRPSWLGCSSAWSAGVRNVGVFPCSR